MHHQKAMNHLHAARAHGPCCPHGALLLALALVCASLLANAGTALAAPAAKATPLPTGAALKDTIFGTDPTLDWPAPAAPRQERRIAIQGRDVPDVFWYAASMAYTVALQDHPAPLMFVVAGTGARHDSDKAAYLTDLFYSMGYHVAALSSPTHFHFLVSISRHAAPGWAPLDVDDLYRVMGFVREDLSRELDDELGPGAITGFDLSGYSLGGMHAAYLARKDEGQPAGERFGFGRVLLINPAVDLYASALRFDSWLEPESLEGEDAQELFEEFIERVSEFYVGADFERFDSDFLYRLKDGFPLTDAQMRALIAATFRMSSSAMIFASDVCLRAGYLVDPERTLGPADSLTPYLSASMRIPFRDYVAQYLLPYARHLRPGLKDDEFFAAVRLDSMAGFLREHTNIVVAGSANDPILGPDEVEFLRRTFGPNRLFLAEDGGHMGNMKNGPFVLAMQRLLRTAGGAQ
jgi:hypothetical protein